ncbi:MAG TPA: hypothetical protein VKF79_03155 [Candidatus Acidoferrum sp.]|nr:hypothetical protein [Candidatus Acidoferrum sp.]
MSSDSQQFWAGDFSLAASSNGDRANTNAKRRSMFLLLRIDTELMQNVSWRIEPFHHHLDS